MALETILVVPDNLCIPWADLVQGAFEQALERPCGLPTHEWYVSNGPVSAFLPLGRLLTSVPVCALCLPGGAMHL